MLEKILRFSKKYLIPRPVFRLVQPFYHYFLAWLGAVICGAPSKKIFVVGITGTKGKTTALEMVNAVLESAGKKTAMFSSVSRKIGSERRGNPTETTMPGRFALQRFFEEAVQAGCTHALVEVTSEGVTRHRHRFIHWDAAVFLNIHPEHIEAHGTFHAYLKAKLGFFRYLKHSAKEKKYFLINKDDSHAPDFVEAADETKRKEVILFSRDDVSRVLNEIKEEHSPDWLSADFNFENAAAANALAKVLGIKDEEIWEAFRNFKTLKGRMDFVQKEPFAVVIDYAHTPLSLLSVYENLRREPIFKKGSRLICVLGSAGGGRDKWKRPELGKIAAHHCDQIFITDEDPYEEDPRRIMEEIKSGIPGDELPAPKMEMVLDRREAIEKAIFTAQKGDVVAITGKGSEEWIHMKGGAKIPWDDRKIVEEILFDTR
ncbi:MAG: UDP-N-acetylmuramyl-tripeptide synthetase [Candidatus Jorgensenbacteria bacterium]